MLEVHLLLARGESGQRKGGEELSRHKPAVVSYQMLDSLDEESSKRLCGLSSLKAFEASTIQQHKTTCTF